MMGMGTGTGRASIWPLTCMPGFCLSYFLRTHLHTDLLRVCLHRLQCSQSTTALHNDPAVLWLAQGQDTQGCTALLAYLQDGSQEWLRPGQQTPAITHFPGECPKTPPEQTTISPGVCRTSNSRNSNRGTKTSTKLFCPPSHSAYPGSHSPNPPLP